MDLVGGSLLHDSLSLLLVPGTTGTTTDMPYSSNSQLPAAARKRLTPHQQDVFRASFNNALKEYKGKESKAYAVAWSAAKKA